MESERSAVVLHFPASLASVLEQAVHALAQPLTVLQMCIVVSRKPELHSLITPELVHDMADEVERATAIYRSLQGIVNLGVDSVDEKQGDLRDVLGRVVNEQRISLAREGIAVEMTMMTNTSLLVPEERTRRVIALLIESAAVAYVVKAAAGPIQIGVTEDSEGKTITITRQGAILARKSAPSLRLQGAEAVVSQCGGTLKYTNDPFHVIMNLRPRSLACTAYDHLG